MQTFIYTLGFNIPKKQNNTSLPKITQNPIRENKKKTIEVRKGVTPEFARYLEKKFYTPKFRVLHYGVRIPS
jgi:hypothetical protein